MRAYSEMLLAWLIDGICSKLTLFDPWLETKKNAKDVNVSKWAQSRILTSFCNADFECEMIV